MKERLAALLEPPRFEDEDLNRRAALLNIALLVLMASTVFWTLATFHLESDPSFRLAFAAVVFVTQIVAFAAVRLRRPTFATVFALTGFWLFFTLGGWYSGGLGRSLGSAYVMLVVVVGLLLGGRSSVGAALVCAASVLLLTYGRTQGWLPEARMTDDGPIPPLLFVCFASVAFFMYMTDRTLARALRESRQQERAVASGRERYRVLTENAVALISEIDDQGHLLYVSPQHRGLLGWEPEELLGTEVGEIVHPDDRERIASTLGRIISTGNDEPVEFRCRLKTGGFRHLASAGRAYTGSDGSRRIVAVSMDNEARVRTEAALQETESQLRTSQRMESLGRLAGGVAHDFNNLLTVILGSARWLERHPDRPADAVRELASEIVQSAEKSADLTGQLLAFSRKQVVETQVLDLDERIEQLSRILKSLVGDEVAIVVTSRPGRNFVVADPSQIEQLIVNLVVNARDAMPAGGTISIRTDQVRIEEGAGKGAQALPAGDYVSLEVLDTGSGMSPDTATKAFDPFFTTKEVGSGTGLGLSTVYGIVKQAGGDIEVTSTLGQGSRFRVCLPLAGGVGPRSQAVGPAAAAPHGCGERVLLAEDSAAVRQFTRRVLEGVGYRVTEASDGEEALEKMRETAERFDALVTDVAMPGVGGVELARRCATLFPEIPVVFVSAYADPELADEGLRATRSRWLKKPFSSDDLLFAIRRLLDESGGEDA